MRNQRFWVLGSGEESMATRLKLGRIDGKHHQERSLRLFFDSTRENSPGPDI